MPRKFSAPCGIVSLALLVLAAGSISAAPQITGLSLRGLQTGATTTLTIDGANLLPAPRLLLPIPIAKQEVAPGATAQRVQIAVTLAAEVSPGIYPLRIATSDGISQPLMIGIDSLPQQPFAPQVAALPVALHGDLQGASILRTTLQATKGQRIVADIEARRLGSNLKPIVRLYDPRGAQVAWSPSRDALGDDARCEAVAAQDGPYIVEIHDFLLRGAAPGVFRLKLGDLAYADQVFPPAISKAAPAPLEPISSSFPADTRWTANVAALPLGESSFPLPAQPRITGAAPRLIVSEHAEAVETAGTPPQVVPAAPVGISGRIGKPNEEDQYLIPVTPGAKLRVEVYSQRLGSPLDLSVVVRTDKGQGIAAGEDQPGSLDPQAGFAVPAGVEKILVAVRDSLGASGPLALYRIVVSPQDRADLQLSADSDRLLIPAGGHQVVRVELKRTGPATPVRFSAIGLPPGVTLSGVDVAADADAALLTFSAAAGSAELGTISLEGQTQGDSPVSRPVMLAEFPGSAYQPALRRQLPVAVVPVAPLQVSWASPEVPQLIPGSKIPVKVVMQRGAGGTAAVRLRLVTSQNMLQRTIKKDAKDQMVDDPERTLRLDTVAVFPPTANEASANVIVPADLPARGWQFAIAAELLAADGKTVTATAYTPVRQAASVQPLALELTSPPQVTSKTGNGPAGKLTGRVVRAAGFAAPVTVRLTGLPPTHPSPAIDLAPNQSDFELPIEFPFGLPAGDLPNVKVVALSVADPSLPRIAARSQEIAVAVKLEAGEKPAAQGPLVVFDDQADFPALLTKGEGQAAADSGEKLAGTIGLKVTAQKFAEKLPSLGVKIRKNPGPGEYRYLRFAWRKQGGNFVALQLNHDGAFGPGGTGRPGALFRYHAGPGGEVFGGSLEIDPKVPDKFVVVTRDLYADFGEFTLDGLGFAAIDGSFAAFDQVVLGRTPSDFEMLPGGK